MKAALIMLVVLAFVGLVLYLFDRTVPADATKPKKTTPRPPVTGCTDESCALHDACPTQQLLQGVCSEKVIYYEDEELNAFKGRAADSYSDADIEQFREVLYTLRQEEIMPWYRSLKRRGILLPEGVLRELVSLASEPYGDMEEVRDNPKEV